MNQEPNLRVLIVEDDPMVSEMLVEQLEDMAYEVADVATNGADAFAMVQELSPDVILMDVRLPDEDGIEVTRRIQELCPTPVVVLTAFGTRTTLDDAVQAGVGAYLAKPTKPSDIQFAISTTIARFKDMMRLRHLNEQLRHQIAQRAQADGERARLLESERRQRLWAETLAEVALALTSKTDHAAVLDEILRQAQRLVAFKTANVMLLEGDALRCAHRQGYEALGNDAFIAQLRQPLGQFSIDAEVLRTGKPYIVSHTYRDPRWEILEETAWIRSCLMVPLRLHERSLGLLRLDSETPDAFSTEDAERLMPLAAAAAIALENARLVDHLEAQVAARTEEIRLEKEKSEAILRSVGDAILMADMDLRIQYANEGYHALTGYAPEELLGRRIAQAGPQLPEAVVAAIQQALSQDASWHGELVVRRKDGRAYDAAMIVAPIQDAHGTVVGCVASHQNVSRYTALERAKNRFITSISHELRTPLSILALQLRKLRREQASEAGRRSIEGMEAQLAQLTHFTEDILELTALDSGKGVRSWQPVDLPCLVEQAAARYQTRAERAGVELLVASAPPAFPLVQGDQERLGQALSELVENALTFTPAGGMVTLSLDRIERPAGPGEPPRTWAQILVHDTGPGITRDELERIFERFYRGRLAESGHVLGTGLGLNIALEIVRAHGGELKVESHVGEGTIFIIALPVIDE